MRLRKTYKTSIIYLKYCKLSVSYFYSYIHQNLIVSALNLIYRCPIIKFSTEKKNFSKMRRRLN